MIKGTVDCKKETDKPITEAVFDKVEFEKSHPHLSEADQKVHSSAIPDPFLGFIIRLVVNFGEERVEIRIIIMDDILLKRVGLPFHKCSRMVFCVFVAEFFLAEHL